MERHVPVYMEVSRLHRTVTIVARGKIGPEEIRGMAQKIAEEKVRSFAKILEVAGAQTEFTPNQVMGVAALLRGASTEKRGPIAFIVDPQRTAFPQAFAEQTANEGPVALFTSLREARGWLERIEHLPQHAQHTPWTDPAREGVMLRGDRQRDVTVNLQEAA
jgi:hypothetical protein